jgi:zinc/manganese transport system substrate-binding protein
MRRRVTAAIAAVSATVVLAMAGAGCGGDSSGEAATGTAEGDRGTIVVTTPMLGALVSELVGDEAEVVVLMPNGADPHDYMPSAREVARLQQADLVVENGLAL